MKTNLVKHLLLCFAIAAVAACGDDSADTDTGDDGGDDGALACTDDNTMCATLMVPDDYAATPRQITVGLYDTPTAAGPPSDILALIEAPTISATVPYELVVEDISSDGDFYVFIALYNEGGGTFQPVAGVDHMHMTTGTVAFTGAPINLGEVDLELVE